MFRLSSLLVLLTGGINIAHAWSPDLPPRQFFRTLVTFPTSPYTVPTREMASFSFKLTECSVDFDVMIVNTPQKISLLLK